MAADPNSIAQPPATPLHLQPEWTRVGAYHGVPPGFDELDTSQGPGFTDLAKLLRKRRRLIFGVAFVFVAAALAYCMTVSPLYTAVATLEIKGYAPLLGEADVESLLGKDTRTLIYSKTTTAKMSQHGLADRALMNGNLSSVVQKYLDSRASWPSQFKHWMNDNPDAWIAQVFFELQRLINPKDNQTDEDDHENGQDTRRYHFPTGLLNAYIGLIDVDPIRDTTLVQLSVRTASAHLSQRIANAHAEAFVERLREETREELGGNIAALNKHAEQLKQKLSEAERRVAAYAENNGIFALPQSRDASLAEKKITDMSDMLAQATSKRIQLETTLHGIERSSVLQASSIDDKTVTDLQYKLREAQAEYAALSHKVTLRYAPLQELAARISSLSRAIQDERRQKLASLRTQYETSRAAEAALLARVEAQRSETNDMSKKMIEYNLLRREADALRELMEAVLKELNQTQISADSGKSNIHISDYAMLPRSPSWPNIPFTVALSLVIGLLSGFAAAIAYELLDNTIETTEDAQLALQLPAIGIIPEFRDNASPARRRNGLLHAAGRKLLPGKPSVKRSRTHSPSRELITVSKPQAAVSEALRTIRAGVLLSSADSPPKVIMVTSAKGSEGKTTLAANLSASLAQAGHRTLLIDADLRKPSISTYFGVTPSSVGLAHYLTGQAELKAALDFTPIQNLWVMAAGSRSPNPAELIGSAKMGQLLRELGAAFDYIILDSPPVLPVTDSLMLSRNVEAVLFVVRSGETEKPTAQEAVHRLRRVGAKILGIIVNDVPASNRRYTADGYSVATDSYEADAGATQMNA